MLTHDTFQREMLHFLFTEVISYFEGQENYMTYDQLKKLEHRNSLYIGKNDLNPYKFFTIIMLVNNNQLM